VAYANLLKLQRLQDKVLCNSLKRTPVRELNVAFEIPKLLGQQAKVKQIHENVLQHRTGIIPVQKM
jgi:hypothetical protein